jgi:assimilatory nitrate reductase catalytic subunit
MDQGVTRTTCPYCGVGCGVLAKREANGTVTIKGDPDHPANFGRLCAKGMTLGDTFGREQRLLKPRINGLDVAWSDATHLVAETFSEAIRDHGPDSVAFYVSGQFLTEDYYIANKLMKGFIGSANIDTNSRLCMASAVAGHKRAFGADVVPCNYTDLETADLVVLVGSNLAWCHPVLFQRLQAAREKRGTKLVVIDPRRTMTAECADLHLQIKSGSDVSLFNGLLRNLYSRGEIDSRFIFARTNGLAETLLVANQHIDDRVLEDTGLAAEQLSAFYDLFATHAKTVTAFSMGVNQAADGTNKVNAIINCHLLTGRIGKEGEGPFSITGQPNAMGGREVGGLANMLAAHMDLDNADHRLAVQDFWKSPRVAQKPGLKAVDLFDAVHEGKIKALWIMATNPAVSMPNSTRVAEALKVCPFVVVSDVTSTSETAAHAHVLLPAKGWGEKDGTVTNSERRISRQRGFMPVEGEAKADWNIMCDVAKHMGFAGFDFESPAEIFAEHAALTTVLNNGNRLLNLAHIASPDYETMPPQQWGGAQPFAKLKFETPDGKARFVTTPFAPVIKKTDVMTYTLNTGRIRDQWHTMTRTGLVPKLFDHRAEPYIEVHPADAKAIGLGHAELATVNGANGASVLRVLISDSVKKGEVFQPMHWSSRFASTPKANAATLSPVDPVSGQPALKSALVSIKRFPAQWYGFGIMAGCTTPDFDYWAVRPLPKGQSFECAGLKKPDNWNSLLAALIDLKGTELDVSYVTSSNSIVSRYVALCQGKLYFAFFASETPVQASRYWLNQLLGTEVGAMQVLAGRPASAVADIGTIVCSCNSVGRFQISAARVLNPDASTQQICELTRAGMGCGSCRPEIHKILQEAQVFAHQAQGDSKRTTGNAGQQFQ